MFKQAARNINLPEKKETSERSNDYFRLLYEIFSLLPYETSIHVSCLYALISKKKKGSSKGVDWERGGEVIQLTGKPFRPRWSVFHYFYEGADKKNWISFIVAS